MAQLLHVKLSSPQREKHLIRFLCVGGVYVVGFFSFCFYFVKSLSSGHVEIITSFPEDVQIAVVASSGNIVHKAVMMAFSEFSVQARSQNLARFASLHWQWI